MRKLNLDDYGEWIASPDASVQTEAEGELIKRRAEIEVITEGGKDLSYEYDEFAVIKLDDRFYLLNTCGCSCPSPRETWTIQLGPTDLTSIVAAISDANTYERYPCEGLRLQPFAEKMVQELKDYVVGSDE